MTTNRSACLWALCLLVLGAAAGHAQTDQAASSGPPPAHLSLIEGQAFIEREGRSETAFANLPLLDGDRLRTENGRLEVILPDGSLLHVDQSTTLDVLAANLLRLLQGRICVIVRGAGEPSGAVRYQIDAPVASVQTGGPGEFRVWVADSSAGREVELAVFRGQATIASSSGAQEVWAGERSLVRDGLAPSPPQYFNSARWDDFDRWSAARRSENVGTASVQYLPPELSVYASTFDRYGTWRYDAADGAVWYPSVDAGWRPYSVGYWHSYPTWGSFWIGSDPWGWPTHHYGYWGFSFDFGWYWRPASVWAPAWVHWAYSPGYVSWCPLGRYGYPVFGHFGVQGHHVGNHVDPWRGWTVEPRQYFGTRTPVHRVAVDGHRLDPAARGAFAAERPAPRVERAVPRPSGSGMAVPRYAGGGVAAPRGNVQGMTTQGSRPSRGPRGAQAPAMPRDGGGRALPDSPSRPSPADAARIFSGSGTRAPNGAMRRPFPATPVLGSAGQRTEAPAATPDVAAFGNRRAPYAAAPRENVRAASPDQNGVRSPGRFGADAPARFGSGAPAQFGTGAPAGFGTGARPRNYPRAMPSAEPSATGGWSAPPAVRQSPYFGRSDGGGGASGPRAYPRQAEPSYRSMPRDDSYTRGGSVSSPPQARPRDGGGGLPAAPPAWRGGASGSSAPPAAPRYNPGSGASQPRGGGASSPPPRRRGGAPD